MITGWCPPLVDITLDLYSHVLDGMQTEAAEQTGAVAGERFGLVPSQS